MVSENKWIQTHLFFELMLPIRLMCCHISAQTSAKRLAQSDKGGGLRIRAVCFVLQHHEKMDFQSKKRVHQQPSFCQFWKKNYLTHPSAHSTLGSKKPRTVSLNGLAAERKIPPTSPLPILNHMKHMQTLKRSDKSVPRSQRTLTEHPFPLQIIPKTINGPFGVVGSLGPKSSRDNNNKAGSQVGEMAAWAATFFSKCTIKMDRGLMGYLGRTGFDRKWDG